MNKKPLNKFVYEYQKKLIPSFNRPIKRGDQSTTLTEMTSTAKYIEFVTTVSTVEPTIKTETTVEHSGKNTLYVLYLIAAYSTHFTV